MAVSAISIAQITSANLFSDTDNANSAVAVKASSTTIYEIEIDNTLNAAQDNYVKFYNTAGAVTVGTTVPDMVILVRQNTKRTIVIPDGIVYGNGLAVATVTAGGTGGTTSPTGDVTVKIVYV